MIERLITPQMAEAAKASPSRLLAFAEIEYENGWIRLHTGHGEREYNGQTYLGVGEFAGVGKVSENDKNTRSRANFSLKLLDLSLFTELLNFRPIGHDFYMHLVAYDENRRIIDGTDYVIDGYVVDYEAVRGDEAKSIPAVAKLAVSDWMERWAQPTEAAKTTDNAQQAMYPGDRFFDLVEIIAGSPLSALPTKSNYSGPRGGTRTNKGFNSER
ncbi:hypothetical protein [Alteromonas confluentis]|uniref:Uncharacterized protein n=1 Tax=Alteromonas confluentis TaxID=1656094 RepID=A0A1E7ZE97_9ALTE|nr:hypothetical protein [Alteromonas confluentis]OFC71821.1 hypothetical protein BFC18_06610 [Alteromonas confluentis]